MSDLNLRLSKHDLDYVVAIAKRACSMQVQGRDLDGVPRDHLAVVMDLSAVHLHAGGLKLAELLNAPAADFAHDIGGIARHLDRKSGQLDGLFSPRYSA